MNTPKPIALVGVPAESKEDFNNVLAMLHRELADHHVLAFVQAEGEIPHIEIHNAPAKKTNIVALRSMIRELCEGKLPKTAPESLAPVEQESNEENPAVVGLTPEEIEAENALKVQG